MRDCGVCWYRLAAFGKARVLRPAKRHVVDMICAGCTSWTFVKGCGGASRPIRLPTIAAYLEICDRFSQPKIKNPRGKIGLLVTGSWILAPRYQELTASSYAFPSRLALRAVGARWNGTLYNGQLRLHVLKRVCIDVA